MYTFRIQDEHTAEFVFAVFVISFQVLGKASIKKNVFFRALPESPNPPPTPLTPIRATWSFFPDVKIQDFKVSLELRILYILYNILYICKKKQIKVQYIGVFEEIDSFY